MEDGRISFTAVFMKTNGGYVGFVEELPGVNSSGRTLDEARAMLRALAEAIFDEERRCAESLIRGKHVVRESFSLSTDSAAVEASQLGELRSAA